MHMEQVHKHEDMSSSEIYKTIYHYGSYMLLSGTAK